jgi:hypothetical protein
VEVERKFLVAEPPELDPAAGDAIEQGYLAINADGVRLRRSAKSSCSPRS